VSERKGGTDDEKPSIVVLVLATLALALLAVRMPPHRKLQLRNLLEQVPSLPARYMV
jgi:hypothetical protein